MKNILFILADCLRADVAFGATRQLPTPAINELRQRGTSFTQMISSATMTTPCVTSFFTGCYPFATGVRALRGDVLPPSIPTLAEVLRARGYRTHALVTGPLWEGIGIARGFEQYEYRKPSPPLSGIWRERIRQLTSDHADPRPWFIYAHFFDLHVPRVIDRAFNRREFGATVYERAVGSFDRRLAEVLGLIDWDKTVVVFHADHGELYPTTRWLERREKIWQDYVLGKRPPFMRVGIKRDPTITAWTRLKRLTKMGHGFNLSEGMVRVPFIIAGADEFAAGKIISEQARQVDIMPTLLELAGAAPLANLSGKSLLSLARSGETTTRPAYMEAHSFGRDPNFFMRGLRVPQWKFIDSPSDRRVKPQLYSLESDPSERENVIRLYPEVVAEMQQLLAQETRARADARENEAWTAEETDIVEERLRNLGYF